MFELLVSGDMVSPDHDVTLELLQQEWGLPSQKPSWSVAPAGLGAKWTFARLEPSRRFAPTAVQILGIPYEAPAPDARPPGYAYLPEIAASQGARPARHHSTVVSTNDLEGLVDRLKSIGARYRVDPPDGVFPFPRLWLGLAEGEEDRYQPDSDGGIRLEVVPHQPLRMPQNDSDFDDQVTPTAGAPLRVVGRTLLLPHLDERLAQLEKTLDWRPASGATGADGSRRVRFTFPYPRSAYLELVDPAPATRESNFLAEWGPGPFSIRIAVAGVDTLESRLDERGVPHETLEPALPGEPNRVFRPATRAIGTAFEFIEDVSHGRG